MFVCFNYVYQIQWYQTYILTDYIYVLELDRCGIFGADTDNKKQENSDIHNYTILNH